MQDEEDLLCLAAWKLFYATWADVQTSMSDMCY